MSTECWIWQSEHVIPSETAAAQRVLKEVVDKLRQSGWIQHDVFSVQLAVEEALVNAIKHGNRHDPSKQVRVCCRMSGNVLRIEIADEGNGFDPAAVPDPTDDEHICSPSGRGVMLMRNFMSRVEFNEAGNRVLMEKYRHNTK